MVYDYRSLTPLDMSLFAQYESLHLLAWSMGVWVAGHLLPSMHERFQTRTAIGGTLDPVHDLKGIPVDGYRNMLDHFDDTVLTQFYHSMFEDEQQLNRFLFARPKRSLSGIHAELAAFQDFYCTYGTGKDFFTKKIITTRDRVFPLKNQLRSWGKKEATLLKLPHFPFYSIKTWQELISLP